LNRKETIMSFLAIAVPVEAVAITLPLLARSALGFGVFGAIVALVLTFKPLLKGMWRALLLSLKPRVDSSKEAFRAATASLLQGLANGFEESQPNQAAELRWFAGRN
jgi:hypothetical protein